jgi:AraC-like DNA-binding protein
MRAAIRELDALSAGRLRGDASKDGSIASSSDMTVAVARAAYQVGYESTSRFCREYACMFGAP